MRFSRLVYAAGPLLVLAALLWPGNPLRTLIAGGSAAGPAADSTAAPPAPEAPPAMPIRIRAVGDVMLGTDFPAARYLPPRGGAALLDGVKDWLLDADLTFMNLEGPFLDGGRSSKCGSASSSCYAFRTPTSFGGLLREVDLDLASLANNHAMDFTSDDPAQDGRRSTMRLLDSLGIAHSGEAGSFASVESNGLRVAMAAYHAFDHSNYLNDEPAAARFVSRLAETHDVVIVSFHGGAEGGATRTPRGREFYLGENRGDLRLFAHTVIDAGADLVIGHGPHVPRGVEVYNGRLVAYSLGNFATYGRFGLSGPLGMAPVLDVTLNPDGSFASGQILSAKQVGEGIPVQDPAGRAAALMSRLSAQDFPESEATVSASGEIRLVPDAQQAAVAPEAAP